MKVLGTYFGCPNRYIGLQNALITALSALTFCLRSTWSESSIQFCQTQAYIYTAEKQLRNMVLKEKEEEKDEKYIEKLSNWHI